MDLDSHSITAVMVAASRAYYSAQPGTKIFDDNLARVLLLDSELEKYENLCVDSLRKLNPTLAASCPDRAAFVYHMQRVGAATAPVLVRGRYIEDTLVAALAQGVRQ